MPNNSFFYGPTPSPEANTVDALIDSLEAKVQSADESKSAAAVSAAQATSAASNAATSETNVAGLADQAQDTLDQANVAIANANSAVVAANAAAGSATTSATSATNSANSATSSATSAANSASSATTSASTATAQATIATTKAGEAATSALAAANSATSATNSASTATTQATSATSSASSATASAATATTKAGEALTSANNAAAYELSANNWATKTSGAVAGGEYSAKYHAQAAATSATAAETAYDSFDDRYLGAKTSNPTLDNDGNALITGALYFNSSAAEMRVWNGSAWVATYLPASGYLPISGGTLTGPTVVSVNSASDALRITQVGAGNAIVVEDEANPDSTPFVVDASGKVGIGTSTPAVPLHISKAGGDANLIVESTSSGAGLVTLFASSQALAAYNSISSNYGSTANSWYIGGNGNLNTLIVKTADTERMRIDNAGQVGIGGTPSAGQTLRVRKAITGSTFSYGVMNDGVVQSDVTAAGYGYASVVGTQATSFTTTAITQYFAKQGTFGVGSTVTNQYGFLVDSNLTGATNNYGFYGNIAAGTGRWNFYAAGTADNYFGGPVTLAKRSLGTPTALTSTSASIAVDISAANHFTHTFTENTTLANPTNLTAGQSGTITLTQHASSPKTLAFGSYWKFPGGTVPSVTASNSAVDVIAYYVESSTRITARLLGDVK